MKRLIIYSIVSSFILLNFKSSAQAFHYGDNILAAGIGFGSSFGPGTYGTAIPAISGQYEHGMWSVGGPGVISLGGYLGYKSFSYDYSYFGYSYSQKWSYTIIGIRSAYHFNMIDAKEWDLYGGLMLSYNVLSYKYSSNYYNAQFESQYRGSYGSGMLLSLYLGGRYFVSPNVSLFGELGYGISTLTLGAAFKL